MAAVKLLMTWNIRLGQEEIYFEFITQEFLAPFLQAGLKLTDAWYTMYGDRPQVMMAFVADDIQILHDFLISEGWVETYVQLQTYIEDFNQKVILARMGFQL